jgi:hypothetical protein
MVNSTKKFASLFFLGKTEKFAVFLKKKRLSSIKITLFQVGYMM